MTEKEIDRMADNFVNTQDFTRVYSIARKAECGAFWKYGFLAGLKAGNPKWHKVKSGDLPPEDTKVLAFMAGGEVCIAHFYRKNVWDKIGIVIAWCEIPQFKDKE